MNEKEIMQMIADHYLGEAQLLTHGAEENLLKLAELRGNMTKEQQQRWETIKDNFTKNKMKGNEEAAIGTEIVLKLQEMVSHLQQLNNALSNTDSSERLTQQLTQIGETMQMTNRVLHESGNQSALISQIGTVSIAMKRLHQTFEQSLLMANHHDNELIMPLQQIAAKLQAIEHTAGLTTSGEVISQQLTKVVAGIATMNEELGKVSEASIKKANWLTRLSGRGKKEGF
jgi:hypothetical protein